MDALFTANKQSRGLDMTLDDSSSVTSISSTSHSVKCKRCGELESLPSKPLVKCPSCHKKRWHSYCHQPPVDARNIPKDWKCKACVTDMTTAQGPSLPSVQFTGPSAPSPSLTSETLINMSARICKEPGCNKPIFQNTMQFCQYHKIQQQYKNATAKKSPGAYIAASGSKPIRKRNLYNFKLDNEVKQLKRKRAAPAKRSVSYGDNELPTLVSDAATQLQRPQQGSSISVVSDALSARPTVQRTPDQRGEQFSLLAGMGSNRSPIEADFDISLGSASMAESSIDATNIDWEGDYLIPHSARGTPQSTGKRPSASPEYSPPPPVEVPPNELNRSWIEPNHDDSPGSQINQELQAIEMQGAPDTSIQPSSMDEGMMEADQQDEEMLDVLAIATANRKLLLPNAPASQQVLFPPTSLAPTSISSSTTPAEDNILDADAISEALDLEIPQSLETKRRQKAATFDTSELDSFLAKQAEPESEIQPTPQELAKTQIWGHINPTVIWPKETSEEWYDEKRREIEARGGRKANFGKLLTAQVRKERVDNKWHIHQNSNAVERDVMAETARHMEELFGIKVDDLVPGVRNGQLVMIEKPMDENGNGRKKKKAASKVYPVL